MSQVGQTLHVPSNIPHPEHNHAPDRTDPQPKRALGHRLASVIVGDLYDEHRGTVAHMRMPEHDRALLELHYLDRLSNKEIAARMGIRDYQVTRRLLELKREIKAHIKEDDTAPLTLDVIDADKDHVVARTNGPARIEMNRYSGSLVLFGYEGNEADREQQPSVAYTS